MAFLVALIAGLLVAAESQPQGFLDHYDKFITPNLNQVKQANGVRKAKDRRVYCDAVLEVACDIIYRCFSWCLPQAFLFGRLGLWHI